MVKRIFGSLMLVLIATVSILAQIDYNKQIKNAPLVSQGNTNGIRVVDGTKFSANGAGINAADADLGATTLGEIWIPSGAFVTATDAQIAITAGHTLRIYGLLIIDAVNKGPIKLGPSAKLACSNPSPDNNAQIIQSSSFPGTVPSMVRLATQDGSQTNNAIEGCYIYAGNNPVTNGVIDMTGMTSRNWIRDNKLGGYTSGWGIFAQDVQSGAMGGTNYIQIQNDMMVASGTAPATGGCIEILHSSTNAVALHHFEIQDINCSAGASIASSPLLFQNLSTGTNISQVNLLNVTASGIPAAQNGLQINGILQFTGKHINCVGSLNCVNIASNSSNLGINLDNILCSGCSNVFNDVANNYVNPNNYINHYGFTASLANYSGNNVLAGTTISGNFNNIRIVDGVKFAQSAAGINAADADLGGTMGEIWIPPGSITATDAQISIRASHTLRIFGAISIDALNKGPILLGGSARITCSGNFGGVNIQNVATQTNISSLVRLSTQDGSLGGMQIDGCRLDAASSTVTNGVLDFSGATNGPSYIKENLISGFASGWGIFIQDIQSGAMNGTNNVNMLNNRILASGTGGCIEILHSATAAVLLTDFVILGTNCTPGASSTFSILLQNTSNDGGRLARIDISKLIISSTPSGQTALQFNGVRAATVNSAICTGSSTNCVSIGNNANNQGLILNGIVSDSGNNVLNDALSSVVTTGSALYHYESTGGLTGYSYFPLVSYLKVSGLAPASATGTGFGTGATFSFETASTNNAGTVIVNTGTTPGSSGTLTVNFNTSQVTTFSPNLANCIFELLSANTQWALQATHSIQSRGVNSVVLTWSNNGVNLTASQSIAVAFSYVCIAK